MRRVAEVRRSGPPSAQRRVATHQLREEGRRVSATRQRPSMPAVRRGDVVTVTQSRTASYRDRFLPGAEVNGTRYLALILQHHATIFELTYSLHLLIIV